MTSQVFYLDEEDDFVSVRDRLDWTREQRVLLVLPPHSDLLASYLDLSLIRRHADKLKIVVGLVTTDGRILRYAKDLGIPTFRSVKESEKKNRRWWRGRRQHMIPGQPVKLEESDRREVRRRTKERPTWQRWLIRYLAVVVFLLTLVILFSSVIYALPAATITLRPKVRDLEVLKKIVADPQLESVNYSGVSAPARVLVTVREWQAEVETTGQVEVADSPSRGSVLFVNDLIQGVTVPAGTRVSTSTGERIVFQTLESVEIPGALGSSAEVEIVAIEPGPDGNVASNLINRIEGPLALQLAVRNINPTIGGESRAEAAVTQEDLDRLRSQVIRQIHILALGEMQEMLSPTEFLAGDSLRIVDIYHETYSHFPGEQTDRVALDLRAELRATAVDETQAAALVYDELADSVMTGYELVPGSLQFEAGELLGADNEGRVVFEMGARGRMAAKLDIEDELKQISGHELGSATTYLFERLPLVDYPSIEIWPGWFERIPYLPIRIRTDIDTSGN